MRAWVHGGGGENGVHGRAAHLCVDCRCRSDSVIKSGRGGVALPVGAESVVAPIRPPEHRQSVVSARSAGALAGGARMFLAHLHLVKSSEADECVHVLIVRAGGACIRQARRTGTLVSATSFAVEGASPTSLAMRAPFSDITVRTPVHRNRASVAGQGAFLLAEGRGAQSCSAVGQGDRHMGCSRLVRAAQDEVI